VRIELTPGVYPDYAVLSHHLDKLGTLEPPLKG
jgi:hypothetical protein